MKIRSISLFNLVVFIAYVFGVISFKRAAILFVMLFAFDVAVQIVGAAMESAKKIKEANDARSIR